VQVKVVMGGRKGPSYSREERNTRDMKGALPRESAIDDDDLHVCQHSQLGFRPGAIVTIQALLVK